MQGYPGRGARGRTVAVVGSRIVEGDIAPGEVLDVAALEDEFDVSRTVVRESLRVLAAKGLVDATFLDQLFEMRMTVEPTVARLAALRRDDGDLEALHQALGHMRRPGGSPPDGAGMLRGVIAPDQRSRRLTGGAWPWQIACAYGSSPISTCSTSPRRPTAAR